MFSINFSCSISQWGFRVFVSQMYSQTELLFSVLSKNKSLYNISELPSVSLNPSDVLLMVFNRKKRAQYGHLNKVRDVWNACMGLLISVVVHSFMVYR